VSDVILDPLSCESIQGGEDAVLDGWLVCEGDHVRAGQVLARATLLHQPVELHAPHDGVIEQIVVGAGERFVPGHVLARVVEF
jgi:pyruvate dehydrogenase E2 component (dihydrolipoamide acetyltransferase)